MLYSNYLRTSETCQIVGFGLETEPSSAVRWIWVVVRCLGRPCASGLNAHHVGQKALMKNFITDYDLLTAPAILVPKVGHTIRGPFGIVSRSGVGILNERQLLARDIFELRRVYPGLPNSALQELIQMNKTMYPTAFGK